MLTPTELTALLADLESDRIERTVSISDTDTFCQAVCAFANDYPNHRQPGYLVIGARNEDGGIVGLNVTDKILLNLAAIRSDGNILPSPAMVVEKMTLPGGDVAIVEVQPSSIPPVRYRGRVYIRVGPRKAVANETEERILSERRSTLVTTFDAHPLREADIGQLTLRLFDEYRAETIDPEIIASNHRSVAEKLASLRFFDLQTHCPTVAGILMFGVNPCFYLPGAYVQFLKFPGTTMSDTPEDQKEFSGDLRTILESVRTIITGYNKTPLAQGDDFRDKTQPDYPEWALRELFHNAVIHRDYAATGPIRFSWFSDRIEIQNPGVHPNGQQKTA